MPKNKPTFVGIILNGRLDFNESEKDKLRIWTESFDDGVELEIQISKLENQRTLTQNNALHKYLELVANALNEAGLTIEKVVKNFKFEHEWTKNSVKELLWREAQKSALGKESTTELSKTADIDRVYELVNRFLAKLGIENIPWPSLESLSELKINE